MRCPKVTVDWCINRRVALHIVKYEIADRVGIDREAQIVVVVWEILFSWIHNISYCTSDLHSSSSRFVPVIRTDGLTVFRYRRRIGDNGCCAAWCSYGLETIRRTVSTKWNHSITEQNEKSILYLLLGGTVATPALDAVRVVCWLISKQMKVRRLCFGWCMQEK